MRPGQDKVKGLITIPHAWWDVMDIVDVEDRVCGRWLLPPQVLAAPATHDDGSCKHAVCVHGHTRGRFGNVPFHCGRQPQVEETTPPYIL